MGTYKDLIEMVVKRELGILGKDKTFAVLNDLNIIADDDGNVHSIVGDGKSVLNNLLEEFGKRYGLWAVLGCKISVLKAANAYHLELPEILTRK